MSGVGQAKAGLGWKEFCRHWWFLQSPLEVLLEGRLSAVCQLLRDALVSSCEMLHTFFFISLSCRAIGRWTATPPWLMDVGQIHFPTSVLYYGRRSKSRFLSVLQLYNSFPGCLHIVFSKEDKLHNSCAGSLGGGGDGGVGKPCGGRKTKIKRC